jgi:hypothetical protein
MSVLPWKEVNGELLNYPHRRNQRGQEGREPLDMPEELCCGGKTPNEEKEQASMARTGFVWA